MELKDYREQIDQIDEQLVQLFLRRMQTAKEIAAYKQAHHLPVLDAAREKEKMDTLCAEIPPQMREYTRALYATLFELSRAYQSRQIQPDTQMRQTMEKQCGLLGRTLAHSYSPAIHALLADYRYDLFACEPEDLEQMILHGTWDGLNVTIPYKKDVMAYCTELSAIAKEIGSVNTLIKRQDGTIYGDNTDVWGFEAMAKRLAVDYRGKKALVLGSGGASMSVQAVMRRLGAQVVVISRTGEDHYGNLERHTDASVLINTTPVGMYPETGKSPVDLDRFAKLEAVLDVVYNPARTQLILDAQARQIPCESGLYMLVAQAARAAEQFAQISISQQTINHVWRQIAGSMQNIVLIGMPGCGKSTIGSMLAERLNRPLIDVDEEIAKEVRMPIEEFFPRYGEDAFREIETRMLQKFGKESGLILATGGGCVTRKENEPLLRQNGKIIWLQRDLHQLPTDGRPVSQRDGVQMIYEQRRALYQAFCDICVQNNDTPDKTVETILQQLSADLGRQAGVHLHARREEQ